MDFKDDPNFFADGALPSPLSAEVPEEEKAPVPPFESEAVKWLRSLLAEFELHNKTRSQLVAERDEARRNSVVVAMRSELVQKAMRETKDQFALAEELRNERNDQWEKRRLGEERIFELQKALNDSMLEIDDARRLLARFSPSLAPELAPVLKLLERARSALAAKVRA